ncbi:MAG: metallophosphoesterase family protein [Chloroflexi bacterium]|nr:metallophosphoesterase family protein [Chloroflexota bacterium]
MARYLIVADIHSNLEAFAAVLETAKAEGNIAGIWCLGDIVGYGPDPEKCIDLLRQYPHVSVAGNHDLAAINRTDLSDFNETAATAALWTARRLSKEYQRFLGSLPLEAVVGDFTLVHGSPRDPVREYIISAPEAMANLKYFDTPYCLVGHLHVPLLFRAGDGEACLGALPPNLVLGKERLVINPGGVGQPRDRDPRASFAIFDAASRSLRHYRVSYDVEATQAKIKRAGLPPSLAERLGYGW